MSPVLVLSTLTTGADIVIDQGPPVPEVARQENDARLGSQH
jgi:hypothetical protein